MSDDGSILRAAADLAGRGEPFVLITVTATKGSTPRDPGAKMIFRPGRGLEGTIGGGQFEYLVLDAARRHFTSQSSGTEHYILGADADQCCGGTMDVFFEYIGARQRVVIFGAGHVAQALAELLHAAPMEVVVADDRPEWNSPDRFPRARRMTAWDDAVAAARAEPGSTLALVMTCSHDTDYELLKQLLAPPAPPAFVGLIGSRSKRVCLFGRLVASGISEALVTSVHCPIGVGDTGKEPKLVAISMAAQVLIEAKKLAVEGRPHAAGRSENGVPQR